MALFVLAALVSQGGPCSIVSQSHCLVVRASVCELPSHPVGPRKSREPQHGDQYAVGGKLNGERRDKRFPRVPPGHGRAGAAKAFAPLVKRTDHIANHHQTAMHLHDGKHAAVGGARLDSDPLGVSIVCVTAPRPPVVQGGD